MRLFRFESADQHPRVGLTTDGREGVDLSGAGVRNLTELLEHPALLERVTELAAMDLPRFKLATVRILAPVERQEIWAAGVTYLRSKAARMEESDFSASAYDRVYDAERPELFFKSPPEKAVGPDEAIGVRRDSKWTVPEPELTLVVNSRGQVVGYTAGNDVSARDIEGENLLYLPQAKVYDRSCALGPCIAVGVDEPTARSWVITLEIERGGGAVFTGQTEVNRIKRGFGELAGFLCRCQRFKHGALLLTGTGIVPPDDFTLEPGDRVAVEITGIGRLENPVVAV